MTGKRPSLTLYETLVLRHPALVPHGLEPPTLCSAEIPLIAIVCQGGTGCNKMVLEHIKKQLPVLVIQGSGGVADLLALAYNEIDRR